MMVKRYFCFMVVVVLVAAFMAGGCAKQKVAGPEDQAMAEQEQTMAGAEDEEAMAGHATDGAGQQDAEEFGLSAEEKARQEAERKAAEREALIEKVSTDIAEPVYFAFDSFEISQEARGKLERKANVLKQHQDLSLVIEGHCDERGTEEYNLALGERRARAAYEYLILLGVDSGRMQIISYGEERPADTDSNEAAWSRNRRCEFKVY